MNIVTDKVTFRRFINNFENSYLHVPEYQRDYVWKKSEQVEEFWEDIEEYFYDLKNNKNVGDNSGLFLGNLILCNQSNQKNIFQIVDGQQRITTIFILLIAFRTFLKSLRSDPKKVESVNNLISNINDYLTFENLDTGEMSGNFFLV